MLGQPLRLRRTQRYYRDQLLSVVMFAKDNDRSNLDHLGYLKTREVAHQNSRFLRLILQWHSQLPSNI